LSYFDYVMLTYERYQALRAIHIRVPGEPGNEAKLLKQLDKSWANLPGPLQDFILQHVAKTGFSAATG